MVFFFVRCRRVASQLSFRFFRSTHADCSEERDIGKLSVSRMMRFFVVIVVVSAMFCSFWVRSVSFSLFFALGFGLSVPLRHRENCSTGDSELDSLPSFKPRQRKEVLTNCSGYTAGGGFSRI